MWKKIDIVRLSLLSVVFGAIGAGAGFLLGGGEDPWNVLCGAIVGTLILPFLVALFCFAKGVDDGEMRNSVSEK